MKIGVLAVQGDFELHKKALRKLDVEVAEIRTLEQLATCDGLIIPGGESTTFVKLLKENGLFQALRQFGQKKTIMGTCAGLITLASEVENNGFETLQLIQLRVRRNAYGRQIDSFIDTVELELSGKRFSFEGVFIRAPKIVALGEGTRALGYHGQEVVMAENEHILVATFHPELTEDLRVHQYFLQKVEANLK